MIEDIHNCVICNSPENLKGYEKYEAFFLGQCRKYKHGTHKGEFAAIGLTVSLLLQADNLWDDQRHGLLNILENCTNMLHPPVNPN
jgi:hypothetical protein